MKLKLILLLLLLLSFLLEARIFAQEFKDSWNSIRARVARDNASLNFSRGEKTFSLGDYKKAKREFEAVLKYLKEIEQYRQFTPQDESLKGKALDNLRKTNELLAESLRQEAINNFTLGEEKRAQNDYSAARSYYRKTEGLLSEIEKLNGLTGEDNALREKIKALLREAEKKISLSAPAPPLTVPKTAPPANPQPTPTPKEVFSPLTELQSPPKLSPILIRSEPPYARLLLNGQVKGETPAELLLPPGKHIITLEKEGFINLRKEIIVKAETPAAYSFALPSDYVQVSAYSQPPGAEVFIDDSFKGYTNSNLLVSPGDHLITIKKPGYQNYQEAVTLFQGNPRMISVALKEARNSALVDCNSDPAGAEVSKGEEIFGLTPLTVKLKPGEHSLVFSLPGYKTESRTLKLNAGEEYRLMVFLTLELKLPSGGGTSSWLAGILIIILILILAGILYSSYKRETPR